MSGSSLPPRRPWWFHALAWILAVAVPLAELALANTATDRAAAAVLLVFVLTLAARLRPWRREFLFGDKAESGP